MDKRWAVNLDVLLKLCMVQDMAQLNPIWEALAKGPRKEERNILQSALDNRAASAGSATKAKLVILKELHTTIVSLSFWSGDMDMLEEGLHPFRTLYTSASKQAQDLARLRTYDSLAWDGTLRLEDIELFQVVLKSHWPTDFLQLDTSLKFFQNLLMVLLPNTHPLVISYTNFLGSWNGLQIPMAEYFAQDHSRPALFLRSLQLRIAAYWQQVMQATWHSPCQHLTFRPCWVPCWFSPGCIPPCLGPLCLHCSAPWRFQDLVRIIMLLLPRLPLQLQRPRQHQHPVGQPQHQALLNVRLRCKIPTWMHKSLQRWRDEASASLVCLTGTSGPLGTTTAEKFAAPITGEGSAPPVAAGRPPMAL